MPIPPEVAFDRYFRGLNLSQQKTYEGKFDIEQLAPGPLRELLLRLQSALNPALANERYVPEHRDHSADLLSALGLTLTQEVSEELGALLLKILIFFVVSHEYTHIVHGHPLSEATDSQPINEVLLENRVGSLDEQTMEADADSYAIYHIMENWIRGVERSPSISLLKMDGASMDDQDELLFACIVVAIGAYFVLHPVPQLDAKNVYCFKHPPHPVRLDSLMETAIGWCQQNRPGLEGRMRPERFNSLLSIVAGLVWEFDELKRQHWKSQVAFLKTPEGASYVADLRRRKNEYRASL